MRTGEDAVLPSSGHITWAQVEPGFHVGSRAGDFLGYVDRQPDGHFRAFDMTSRSLGEFTTLPQAIDAVNGTAFNATAVNAAEGEVAG